MIHPPDPESPDAFGGFVAEANRQGRLVVQPRMGFGTPGEMRAGLEATKNADAETVGTITLDSYTRVRDDDSARKALRDRRPLNGFPIVAHGADRTRRMIDDVGRAGFPVQVRHGSAQPEDICDVLVDAGLHATEGGPLSYCLPYSRTPVREALRHWRRSCEILTRAGPAAHLETFGGCMLGQLCPPGLLVAISVLEAMFFVRHGVRSVSLSYAQQTSPAQDREALDALTAIAAERLPGVDRHVVLYTYMGVYPRTEHGALALARRAAELAVWSGAGRLIVKTAAEAHRIPAVVDNVVALEASAAAARRARDLPCPYPPRDTGVLAEATALIDAVCALHDDVGEAMVRAIETGRLDIPFCLHPDNAGRSRCHIGDDGRLVWSRLGSLPLTGVADVDPRSALTSDGLLEALTYVQRSFDDAGRPAGDDHATTSAGTGSAPVPAGPGTRT